MPRPRAVGDEAVLDAVARIIQREGPGAVTFARVAQEVGLSPASLVQRFGNKRGLLLATTIRGWGELLETFARARESNGSPMEALMAALTALIADVRTRESLANGIAFLHIDLSDPEFHHHAVAGSAAMRERIEALLVEAVRAGEIVETDTERLAAALQNTYNGSLITWAMSDHGSVDTWVRGQITFLLAPFRSSSMHVPGDDRRVDPQRGRR